MSTLTIAATFSNAHDTFPADYFLLETLPYSFIFLILYECLKHKVIVFVI